MTCRTCKHRLDVTLWGCWLATGCRIGLVLRDESAKKTQRWKAPRVLGTIRARVRLLAQGTFRACARGWYPYRYP